MNAPQTTIACPSCGTRCMVPGGIFQFNCPSCQTLCRIAPPVPPAGLAATGETAESAPGTTGENPDKTSEDGAKEKKPVDPIVAVAVAGGVLVVLLLIFAVAAIAVMSLTEQEVAEVEPPPPPPPIIYREVDLPESTRQQIYRDIRTAEKTTVGAKVPLPKDSDIGRFWQENMQKVMNREFTLHTLLNDITEADLKEIIKEGNAKDW